MQNDLKKTKENVTCEIKQTVRIIVKEFVASELNEIQMILNSVSRKKEDVKHLKLTLKVKK